MTEFGYDDKNMRYLKMLSRNWPTIQSVCTEIINLRALLNLPKGTEHFISDIHGEYEGFRHILRNASGNVKRKIDQALDEYLPASDRDNLASLIYYPEQKMSELKKNGLLTKEWYTITLKQLIAVCKITTSKYTQSKVREMLPKDFEYVITELMTTGSKDFNKERVISMNQRLNNLIKREITRADDGRELDVCYKGGIDAWDKNNTLIFGNKE